MRQYHSLHHILPYSFTMAHQNSHFSRMISDWSMLLTHFIEVADTDTFKTELQLLLYASLHNLCDCVKNLSIPAGPTAQQTV